MKTPNTDSITLNVQISHPSVFSISLISVQCLLAANRHQHVFPFQSSQTRANKREAQVGHPHGRKLTSFTGYNSSSPNHKKAPSSSPSQSIAAQSSQRKSYASHYVPRPNYAPTHDRASCTNTPTNQSWTHDSFPNSSCGEWRSNGN